MHRFVEAADGKDSGSDGGFHRPKPVRASKPILTTLSTLFVLTIICRRAQCQFVSVSAASRFLASISRSCANDTGFPTVCQPFPPFNVIRAPLTTLSSNGTCEDEVACVATSTTGASVVCSNCSDALSTDNLRDIFTTDTSRWQSGNLMSTDEAVSVEAAFNLPLLLLQVSMDQPSPAFLRPTSIDIELSSDKGRTWRVAGHFRLNCSTTGTGLPCVAIDLDIQAVLSIHLRSIVDLAEALDNSTSAERLLDGDALSTNFRVVFLELQAPRLGNQSLFYALTRLQVVTTPYCSGRSTVYNRTNPLQPCQCQHNTTGPTCNLCNGQPFPAATSELAEECEELILPTTAQTTVSPTTNPSTGAPPSSPAAPKDDPLLDETELTIVIAASGGVVVLLLVILMIVLLRRRSGKEDIGATILIHDAEGARHVTLERGKYTDRSRIVTVHDASGVKRVTLKHDTAHYKDTDSSICTSTASLRVSNSSAMHINPNAI